MDERPRRQYSRLDDEIRAANLEQRTIIVSEDIEDALAYRVLSELGYLATKSSEPIRILFNSPGGEIYPALAMYNAILASKVAVDIEVVGLCASAATVVLQAARRRLSRRAARFMVHEVADFKFLAIETATEAEENAEELKKVNRQLIEIVAARAAKTADEILKLVRKRDYWMSAAEAREFGLVDEII